ncbi:MAG: L-glyceraldehyde 3-phosphate reductase, partial [Hymenobacter sp.]
GVPADSRAARQLGNGAIEESQLSTANLDKARQLNQLAGERNQTLAQMALAWVLRDPRMTSVIIGASKPQQVTDAVGSLANLSFSDEELAKINAVLAG